jgi:hypothetical protein
VKNMRGAEGDETRRRRDGVVDWRTLRFAVGFPVVLAGAFWLAVQAVARRLPTPVAFRWESQGGVAFTDLAGYLTMAVLLIIVPTLPFLVASGLTNLPVLMRRIMLSAGITLSLFLCTVAAAGLAGQFDVTDARNSHVDNLVLLLGTGGALGLGLLVHYVYTPLAQWDPRDDRALQRELQALEYPELAAVDAAVWARPRTSVLVMTGLLGIFPAALVSIVNPWLALVLLVLAVAAAALLILRVRVSREGLSLRLGGFLPVCRISSGDIRGAEALEATAADYGGWGPRTGERGRSFLVASGPAVVVLPVPGGGHPAVTFSAPDQETAERLASALRSLARPA